MMRQNVRRAGWIVAVGLACAVVLTPAVLSAQDLTLKSTTTANGKETAGTQYFSTIGIRNSSGGADTDVIIRLDQKKYVFVNNKQKTYSEMTFDEMQKTLAALTGGDNMPPEAAAAMKKFMGGMGGDVTVTPMGPGEAMAGYPTEKYHVTMGTMMEIDLWAAPAVTIPSQYYDGMKAITANNPMLDMRKLYEEFKKIKGAPLKQVMNMKMMGRSMTTTMVVTAVEKGPIPAAVFEPPAGFKSVPMNMK